MSEITISKVKLIKGGEKLELVFKETVSFEKGGTLSGSGGRVYDNHVHPDLKNAIDSLACHLAIQTDYLTEKRAMDKDELEKFVVTGYSVGGGEEEEGVVITGHRKTKAGKTVTLNTPFLKLDADPKTYYLIDDLNTKIQTIESEVELYLETGKKAPDAQLDMFSGQEENKKEEPVTNIQIDHPESEYTGTTESPVVKMSDKERKFQDKLHKDDAYPYKETKGKKKKVAQSAEVPSGEMVMND